MINGIGIGKLVDILAAYYDIIARFNGGSNAGEKIYLKMLSLAL
jgi:adenylosuccinate synthase